MTPFPPQFTYLLLTLASAVILHGILWARNSRFLWSRRSSILQVVLLAELWMIISDPIGGRWGAWFFDFHQTLGIRLFEVMPIEDLLGIAIVSSAAACGVLVFGYGPRRWI
jgi:lycopene cyclase domain-containing protein